MTVPLRSRLSLATFALVLLVGVAPAVHADPPEHAAEPGRPDHAGEPGRPPHAGGDGGGAEERELTTYVALGDSFAAGPVIPLPEEPWGCRKSTNNYAKHLAARLEVELRDATCSGAKTTHMESSQDVSPEPNPPQLDRVTAEVDLVTLQIGGNDIGFSGIAEACVRAVFEGDRCEDQFVGEDGSDELRRRIAETKPKIVEVIEGIRSRAPEVEIMLLGYSGIFRIGTDEAGCPAMVVDEGDATYLRGVHEDLNEMIAGAAAEGDATYVDVYWPSAGKTACDLPVLRWVEPIVPVNAAAPIHPNLTGMLGVTDLLERAVTGTATGPLPVG